MPLNEADTCRKFVVPKLQAAGWDTPPHAINEQRTFYAAIRPDSIARNKTLSSKKLPMIEVPAPPLEQQRWFDRLQRQVRSVETLRESAGNDVEGLLPSVLHQAFNAQTNWPPRGGFV